MITVFESVKIIYIAFWTVDLRFQLGETSNNYYSMSLLVSQEGFLHPLKKVKILFEIKGANNRF